MTTDIRLQIDWYLSPKIKKLGLRHGPQAVVSLITLWAWAGKNRPTGLLRDMDNDDIAIVANWTGNPDEFVDCLIKLRLIDEAEEGLALHDWEEHQPEALRRHRYLSSGGYDENGNRLFPDDWLEIKASVYRRDGRICQYCGKKEGPFHIDHVIPRINGGMDSIENLVVACAACNLSKGSKSVSEWLGVKT